MRRSARAKLQDGSEIRKLNVDACGKEYMVVPKGSVLRALTVEEAIFTLFAPS